MPSTSNDVNFPDKYFYKIGEVSKIIGVEPNVIRYWEKEFKIGKKKKLPTEQRKYQKKDILKFLEIKNLLYEQKYTIEGAKEALKKRKNIIKISFLLDGEISSFLSFISFLKK